MDFRGSNTANRTFPFAIIPLLTGLAFGQAAIDPAELHVSSALYQPPGQARLHVESRLVEVGVVVRDSHGEPVDGLSRDNFELRDQGKQREITAFSVHTVSRSTPGVERSTAVAPEPALSQPRQSVVLLFDDRNSSAGEFQQAKNAATRYLQHGLEQGTRAAIFTIVRGRVLSFTSDSARIAEAIAALNPGRDASKVSSTCPTFTPYTAYVVANYLDRRMLEAKVAEMRACDPGLQQRAAPPPPRRGSGGRGTSASAGSELSIEDPVALRVVSQARLAWNELAQEGHATLDAIGVALDDLSVQPGSRVLLLASSGFLAGSLQPAQQKLIDRALRQSIVINALDMKGVYIGGPSANFSTIGAQTAIQEASIASKAAEATNDAMQNLALSTGGRFFHNSNDLEGGIRDLTATPAVSYLIGFVPEPDPSGGFHRIKVQVRGRKGYTLQARAGYAAEAEKPAAPRETRRIDREVFTTSSSQDVPAGVDVTYEPSTSNSRKLRAAFSVDVRTAGLIERGGLRRQKLTFLVALLDSEGNFVTGKEGEMEFALKAKTFDRLSGTRLDATLQLEAPLGGYRLRVLVEDANQGRLTAASRSIQVK